LNTEVDCAVAGVITSNSCRLLVTTPTKAECEETSEVDLGGIEYRTDEQGTSNVEIFAPLLVSLPATHVATAALSITFPPSVFSIREG